MILFVDFVCRKNQRIRSSSRLNEQKPRSSRSYDNEAVNRQQDDESDDDDDVVIGSSTSLTRFRNDDHSTRTRSRNPTIYEDPDAAKNQRHHLNDNRTKGNLSEFMVDEVEEEHEDTRRRRNMNSEHMGKNKGWFTLCISVIIFIDFRHCLCMIWLLSNFYI